MPFIGLDWRSPGECWIKTPSGSWERLKILENSLGSSSWRDESPCASLSSSPNISCTSLPRCRSSQSDSSSPGKENSPEPTSLTTSEDNSDLLDTAVFLLEDASSTVCRNVPANYQPYCHITNRPTRETRASVSLSEAFWKLDFPGAVRDIRRFNYICKVLDVLIAEKLSSLGGQAQKLLFNTLQDVLGQVVSTQQNMHIIRQLMHDLNEAMEESQMSWGKHMGSSLLWEGHRTRLQEWNRIVNELEMHQREEDGKVMLADLPEECLRLVLLCLSDHHDLMRSKEALSSTAENTAKYGQIFSEQRLWRELCFFHFKPQQLKDILGRKDKGGHDLVAKEDWEQIYLKMKRCFGLRESYAEILHLCTHCRALFWEKYGHPCPVVACCDVNSGRNLTKKAPIPVSPRAFLDFFSL
ncbi:hypothetical protein RvY_16962 [Ramazzottius varieornatus]|uniref:F-box domain-containing protein n=1 Tax=Ramazzottius varieornatus TaxID=947166 RepID=A0A1D1W0F2_RAMVA|nr:hypothetical protein RvY_16962 [Ramazzottius varieornatus]